MSGLGKELRSVILIIDSSNNYFCNYLIGFFLVYKMLKKTSSNYIFVEW